MRADAAARTALVALAADIGCVLLFSALGRRNHAEGLTVAGILTTAGPFLAGTALGWLLAAGWRNPTAVIPTGIVVWVATVAGGMLLRQLLHRGVAPSFIGVAATVTGVLLLGWRAGWRLRRRPRR